MSGPGVPAPGTGQQPQSLDLGARDPQIANILRWFEAGHLAGPLRAVSVMFRNLAWALVTSLSDDDELLDCLRNLLRAKDSAVRAQIADLGAAPGWQPASGTPGPPAQDRDPSRRVL